MDGLWAKKMCLVEAKELKGACRETTKSPGMVLIRLCVYFGVEERD